MLIPAIITLILWTIGVILLLSPATETKFTKWYSVFIFALSLGYPVEMFNMYVNNHPSESLHSLQIVFNYISAISFRFCPYLILQAAISYLPNIDIKIKKKLHYLLTIPIIAAFIIDFIFPKYGPQTIYLHLSRMFWTTSSWAVPYGFIGVFLFLYEFLKEKNPKKKRNKLFVVILNLPLLASIIISYSSTTLEAHKVMWLRNAWPVIGITFIFFVLLMTCGIVGLKLRLEKASEDAKKKEL
jgi:hypothetical protein